LEQFVDVTEVIARSARKLVRSAIMAGYSLSGADAVHLASATFVGVREFVTYDNLNKLSTMAGLSILAPYVTNPRLL
jgi:predicted nucleic acid-binding protein